MPPSFDFDIDAHLNRFIPHNHLYLLPKPISWFLGYREHNRRPIGNVLVWWWAFIGAFVGLLVVEGVYMSSGLRKEGAPIVIASLGAAAILEFHTLDSPLSQPRNAILGELISAFIGISMTKLFLLSPHFHSLRFIAGALSVGLASAAMGLTKTVHPPAGATALLCATNPEITALGWMLLPLIVVGSGLLVGVGCVVNNIQRTFPVYWWTAVDLRRHPGGEGDVEKAKTGEDTVYRRGGVERIEIDAQGIVVPEWLELEYEEEAMLEILRKRICEGRPVEGGRDLEASRSRDSEMTRVSVGVGSWEGEIEEVRGRDAGGSRGDTQVR